MGYCFVMGDCYACRKTIIFNPNHVPSVRINGNREPICQSCVKKANVLRGQQNLPQIQILPDAYKPCNEEEL